MLFTVLMIVVLIVGFALMFGLTKFSENVITSRKAVSTDDSDGKNLR